MDSKIQNLDPIEDYLWFLSNVSMDSGRYRLRVSGGMTGLAQPIMRIRVGLNF